MSVTKKHLHKVLQKEMTRKEFLVFSAVLGAAAFGVVGVIKELLSQAATPTASKEPELGTLAAGAVAVNDATASGGKAVKFAQETTPPPTTGFDFGMAYQGNGDPSTLESDYGAKLEARRTYFQADEQTKAVNVIKADIAAGRKCSAISFKLPYSWQQMASGSGDSWAQSLATTLAAARTGSHRVRIGFHHEPENDYPEKNADGTTTTTAQRQEWARVNQPYWTNMQARLAPFFDIPGFQFVCILMGYHSFSFAGSAYTDYWNLEKCIPNVPAIKGIGFDIYQGKGVDGKTNWTDMGRYFTAIGTFTQARGLAWGLSETGVAATAYSEWPAYKGTTGAEYFKDQVSMMKASGGSWYEYFNSDLNSPDPKWSFVAGEARSTGFANVLKAERAN